MYWIAAACAMVILYCSYWFRRPNGLPPGPIGVPVLGILPFLGKNPQRKMKKWSESYGSIMSVRIGTTDQIVLNSHESIMEALVRKSVAFSGRPYSSFYQQVVHGNGLVFLDYGEKFKSQRKFGLTTLRGFGVGKKSMENQIIEEIADLSDSIRSKNGDAFDISVLIKNAVLNNICSVVVGRRFDYDDPRFQEIIRRLLERYSEPLYNAAVLFLMLAPKLRYIPPFSYYNKLFVQDNLAVGKVIDDIIKEHEETFDSKEMRDFLDSFLNEKHNKSDPTFTNDQLIAFTLELFSGGTETTAGTLTWCLLCCLHYPQAQMKLRKEILDIYGPHGTISFSKKSEMPYTNAFIQEAYRFRTTAPLSLPRKTTQDTEIGGYFIPRGTTVVPNIWAVHNDEKLFEEPEKFKPERFLDEKGTYLQSKHVIPFGVGHRSCLGEQLARMEVFMFLVGMIQKFEFLPDPEADQLPDINNGANGLFHVALPFNFVANLL